MHPKEHFLLKQSFVCNDYFKKEAVSWLLHHWLSLLTHRTEFDYLNEVPILTIDVNEDFQQNKLKGASMVEKVRIWDLNIKCDHPHPPVFITVDILIRSQMALIPNGEDFKFKLFKDTQI